VPLVAPPVPLHQIGGGRWALKVFWTGPSAPLPAPGPIRLGKMGPKV
jgi:hypothetical protein